jgi:Cu-processing system permease protein
VISTVITIANNSFKETIRNKVLYNILLFAGLIIGLSVSFGQWSVFARLQVMNDFGLATMSISSLLLAVFVGSSMLGKEISGRTIYLMVTRPIPRASILWGKFFGVYATLFLNFSIMSLFLWISLKFAGGGFTDLHIKALSLLFIELGVVLAASLLFSVLSSPSLAAIFTIGFYIIGHLNDLIGIETLAGDSIILKILLKLFNIIIPNLEQFNIRSIVVYNGDISWELTGLTAIYGFFYIAIALVFATISFEKKDL